MSPHHRVEMLSARVRDLDKRKRGYNLLPKRPTVFIRRPTPAERIERLSARLTKGKMCVCKHSKNDHLPWRPGKKRKRECLDDDCNCKEFTPR